MQEDVAAVTALVHEVFRAGMARDFGRLRAYHLESPAFSRWANRPGGVLLDAAAAHEEEEAAFGAMAPEITVTPEQVRVDVVGDVAVSAFIVRVATGNTTLRHTRGTLVWQRTADGWRILHEHFSP